MTQTFQCHLQPGMQSPMYPDQGMWINVNNCQKIILWPAELNQVHYQSDSSRRSSRLSDQMSTNSSLNTRGRGRGRPRTNTISTRGRPRGRSNESKTTPSTTRSETISGTISTRSMTETESMNTQSFDLDILRASKHKNGKRKYPTFWFHWVLNAASYNLSPHGLTQVIRSMSDQIEYLENLEIPSISFLKSLRLSVDSLNFLQSNLFINDHDEYVLTFDESPSR